LEEFNDILIGREKAAGVITLNRPRARNALNTAMRAKIADALPRWVRDPEVYAVVIDSAVQGEFCAGGDLREMVEWGRTRPREAQASLAAEYSLNWHLECLTKPTISLIDGLVVGSGVGITLYGTHRIAGERYRFAMPETAIGLFPDDGVCHTFAHMPDQIGAYLALTGRWIGRSDAYHLGLVTHCIAASAFSNIRSALGDAEPVDALLDVRHEDPGPGELSAWAPVINRCFNAPSVEEIVDRLGREQGAARAWAQAVLEDLARRSPTSLKIALRHVRRSGQRDLRATLIEDYRIARRCMEREDFYEGVRAAIIDKDKAPHWQPARLEDVSDTLVESHFAPLGKDDLALPGRAEMQAVDV
jgi:enoyl-CoA hydratase